MSATSSAGKEVQTDGSDRFARRPFPKPSSSEDLPGRASKATQIDSSVWRIAAYQARSRPTSLSQLSYRHNADASYAATQSEGVLGGPRSRLNTSNSAGSVSNSAGNGRHTAVDMSKLTAASQRCQCRCACGNGAAVGGQQAPYLGPENQDNPEGLSWRRLHMCRAKLKATATTSELLSGFAMVAMVELQINEPTAVPEWLFVMFAVCTTVLVSVHIFALMISTYLLPNVEAISKLQVSRLVSESPHERMRGFIELAWAFSTVLGLFLFLVEVAILCWVKFWDYSFTAATASTVIVIPVLVVFIAFAVHFYHSLVVYKCEATASDMKELENIKRNLDNLGQSHV
ncbi:calcium release-activated calcium channel protein 1-like [Phymastichus coffea]|uniref:calcium release-activated calcium channel protein 1-like n=1 Tax=Phymastichus coffea TaxID=108790 RepID=UPI00273B20AA|nr:calcium release-activated calcium channel protein 1-like [Phymastichus coffea]